MTPRLFSELGLSEPLLKAIDQLGFEQAAPIQAAAIPLLMAGRDIVGQSQTGSGKTAAFGIPAVEKVEVARKEVQVLVLCPTRELAVQVSEELHKLALYKRGLHVLPIYGGQSYERQFHGLSRGAHIVIGTPGRVMDHLRRGTLRLDTVRLVVLDEADVMLNMGFREDIELILESVPRERQTVFFSATMPRPIRDLIERFAREPENVRIEQKALTVPTVEQVYYEVDRRFKLELLTRLIDIHDLRLGIIFCNTKRMVDELADHLEAQGYQADRLHGDMSQQMRDRVMNKFRKSGLEFLVATDVAARGIDVDDVQVVFNYDLPYDAEDYVHRIGRTGRAGRSGRAITFVAGRELFQIRAIERYTNTRIHRSRIPTLAEVEEARENVFLDKLRAMLEAGDFRRQEPLIERLLEEGYASTDIASACLAQLQGIEPAPAAPPSRPPRPERERPSEDAGSPPAGGGGPKERGRERSGKTPAAVEPPTAAAPRPEAGATPAAPVPEATVTPAAPHPKTAPAAAPVPPPAPAPVPHTPTATAEPSAPTLAPEPPAAPSSSEVQPEPGPAAASETVPQTEAAAGATVAPAPEATSAPRPAPELDQAAAPAPAPAKARERAAGHAAREGVPRPTAPPKKQRRFEATEPDRGPRPFVREQHRPPPPGQSRHPEAPRYPREPRPPGDDPRRKSMPPWLRRNFSAEEPTRPPHRTRTPSGVFTRLHLNVGEAMGVGPGDIVGAIAGETGLPARVVGVIDVRDRHLFVDVVSDHANAILSKLNRTHIKGYRVRAKVA